MKKVAKYAIAFIAMGLLAYNSVYFKPLDEVKAAAEGEIFDVVSFVNELMESKMHELSAIPMPEFYQQINSNFDLFMESKGRTLGVSDLRYFMVQGEGTVIKIEEENVIVQLDGVTDKTLRLAVDFIFGSTLRDASGLVSISDYASTMDFNNISVEMNKQVQQNIVPAFIDQVQVGSKVAFVGATSLNINEPLIDSLRLIPVKYEILP